MPKSNLSHIPGSERFFGLFDTLKFFDDPRKLYLGKKKKYGNVYRSSFLGKTMVSLLQKDATRFLLVDNHKIFHSKEPWELVLKELFPNGLMLMDGEEHKHHRSIVAEAFKKGPLEGYLKLILPIIENFAQRKETGNTLLFPMYKSWTLEIALEVFFGLRPEKEIEEINTALTQIVKASTAFPIKLPFTKYGKGVRARKKLVHFFRNQIQQKMDHPGEDLFSILCHAKNEEGEALNEQQIIDHLIFILMAAHDTTASTLTSLSYFLAKHPEWQDRCRKEVLDFYKGRENLKVRDLRELSDLGLAIKETLRLYPPLISISRKSTEDIQYAGYDFPKGTTFGTTFEYHHLNPEVWDRPHDFDPERFGSERKEHMRCPYAYSPFGAGIHHCIGFAFAETQIKLIIGRMLQDFEWKLKEGYEIPMKSIPIQEPSDGLPIYLERRKA